MLMDRRWNDLLPDEYVQSVIQPSRYERHAEPSANAEKIYGYDANNNRCFYYHTFLVQEEGFDVDEFPILINVYYERVVAWRKRDGQWIKLKTVSDRLDKCNNRIKTLPIEVVESL
jgi:hypothetical protein